jgi:hypothetical protein
MNAFAHTFPGHGGHGRSGGAVSGARVHHQEPAEGTYRARSRTCLHVKYVVAQATHR